MKVFEAGRLWYGQNFYWKSVYASEYKMLLLSDRHQVYRNQTWHEDLKVNKLKIIVARLFSKDKKFLV
jgi:hypothetical protein